MPEPNSISENHETAPDVVADDLLNAYLAEHDDVQAAIRFNLLLRRIDEDLLRDVSESLLVTQGREDLMYDVQIRLWRAFEKCRLSKDETVYHVWPYSRAIARSVQIDAGHRRESRVFANLYRRVRYLFSSGPLDSPFAFWCWNGVHLFGFKAWSNDAAINSRWQTDSRPDFGEESLADLNRFLRSVAPQVELRSDLPLLVGLTLIWIDTPVRLSELIEWIAAVLEIAPVQTLSLSDPEDSADDRSESVGAASQDNPATNDADLNGLSTGFELLLPHSKLVLLLPLEQNEALLLADERGLLDSVADLLVQAGLCNRKSGPRNADRMWEAMPLEDSQLAEIFTTTSDNVEVMRNRARMRLVRILEAISA